MTNLEYLEKCRTEGLYSEDAKFDNYIKIRQAKALEIIADELIKLNERFVSITGSDDFIRVRLKGTN